MSGYTGNPDAESEHALILSENGVHAARQMLQGPVRTHCKECADPINPDRVELARKEGRRCEYCIDCQVHHDKAPGIKMLDRIL